MRSHVRHRAHNAAALAVRFDAERDVLTRESAFRATRRLDGCYTFFAFPPVGSDFPYASPGNVVRTNIRTRTRGREGKLSAPREEGSIDALSPVRPETPARNKPAREEDDGDDEATTAVVSTITHARIRSSRALVYFFFFEA